MAAKTNVDYYWRFEFIQSSAGSENAKIKIEHYHDPDTSSGKEVWTIDTLIEELEITSTDASNPTVWTGTCAGCNPPGVRITGANSPSNEKTSDAQVHKIKVTLLNDYYLDADTDRQVTWVDAGYAPKWMWDAGDGDQTKVYKGALSDLPASTADYDIGSDSNFTAYTPGSDKADYQQCFGAAYEGDENGTVNTDGGWHNLVISTDYVTADLQTPSDGVWTW
jgi:hypothetical protein